MKKVRKIILIVTFLVLAILLLAAAAYISSREVTGANWNLPALATTTPISTPR